MRVLNARVDALYLAFRGELRSDVASALTARLSDAKELGTGVALELGGMLFMLGLRSREGWWRLENADCQVLVEFGEHLRGWSLQVTPRATMLATAGARAALDVARRIAGAALVVVEEERVRRVDLCADMVGFGLERIDATAWLTQRRTGNTVYAEHGKAERRLGFSIGKGDLRARAYDKRAELEQDASKRSVEESIWRARGWGGEDVARVEFQIRGEAMKELEDGTLRAAPDKLLERLDSVWGYCTRQWLRLIVAGTASRRCRCDTDARWRVVQAVTFDRWDGELAQRIRGRSKRPRTRVVFGAALDYQTARGLVRGQVGHVRPSPHREESSRQYIEAIVAGLFAPQLVPSMTDELIASCGDDERRAALFVFERLQASEARCASAVPDEPHTFANAAESGVST